MYVLVKKKIFKTEEFTEFVPKHSFQQFNCSVSGLRNSVWVYYMLGLFIVSMERNLSLQCHLEHLPADRELSPQDVTLE